MEGYTVLYLVAMNWLAYIFLCGSYATYAFRKEVIIRNTFPLLNIPASVLYLIASIAVTIGMISGGIPCFIYLWLPSVLAIFSGNAYIVKFWHAFVLRTYSEIGKHRYNANYDTVPTIPDSMTDIVMFQVPLKNDHEEDEYIQNWREPPRDSYWRRFRYWIFRNPAIGGQKSLFKIFFAMTAIELVLPIILHFSYAKYRDPWEMCNERSLPELYSFMTILLWYMLMFAVTTFVIRRWKESTALKKQLLYTSASWMIVLFVFLVLYASKPKEYNAIWEHIFGFFSILCWILPFSSDVLLPLLQLYKKRQKKDKRAKRPNIETLIKHKTEGEHQGWDLLMSFVSENMASDAEEHNSLFNALLFLHEFTKRKNEVVGLSDSHVSKKADLDVELCGLVIIAWFKYLHEKGLYTWEMDTEAPLLVKMKEIEGHKKDLEDIIRKITTTESFSRLTPIEQKEAGIQLGKMYKVLVNALESRILGDFYNSEQFEIFQSETKTTNDK